MRDPTGRSTPRRRRFPREGVPPPDLGFSAARFAPYAVMPLDVLGKRIPLSPPPDALMLTDVRPHARYTDRASESTTLAGRPG